jgi:uncharacterized protein (DUF2267 family)
MHYDEFIGRVQNRARLASSGEAVRAIRATLEVLGERLFGGEAQDLAAQLPREIAHYLTADGGSESFGLQEFFRRVSEREQVELPDAIHHARAVISVVRDAVSEGEMQDVLAQLPEEYNALFESGSEGEMQR